MRTSVAILVAASVLSAAALPPPLSAAAAAEGPAVATKPPVSGSLSRVRSLGIGGVSVHAAPAPDGSVQLYYSSAEGGTAVDRCTSSGSCTRQTLLQGVSDVTIVTLRDGTRRAYFIRMDPQAQVKRIWTAVVAADGLSLSQEASLGIESEPGARAWGVPDSVVMPDGRVRLYWVDTPTDVSTPGEAVVSATSTDTSGTSFTRDAGYRTVGGIVDFEVLRAKSGAWLAVASTTPGRPPQRLVLAVSTDGLAWKVNRASISPRTANYLDPSGFRTGRNVYRLYMTTSPLSDPFSGFVLHQATLTVRLRR